ncbi:protein TonB [Pseudomonas sp. TE3786]
MTLTLRKASGWTVSWLLVLAVHIGIGLWALYWHAEAKPAEPLPPPAMIIELPPLPEVVPPPPPAPAQMVEPEPEPQPEVVEAPKPKLVLEKPKPKPKPQPKVKPIEPPKPEEKPVEQTVPDAEPAPPAPPAAPQAPQPSNISTPSDAKATWMSKVQSHLARYKRYPEEARRRGAVGTTRVRFSVDADGKLLNVEVTGTSGNAVLDRATLSMFRRAQPLPKPPAEVLNGNSVEVNAPFDYSLDRK